MDWYDKAEKEIEDDYEQGRITLKEYNDLMRDLRAEWRETNPGSSYDDFR